MMIGFDERNIPWQTLEGIPDVWYYVLEVDERSRIVRHPLQVLGQQPDRHAPP